MRNDEPCPFCNAESTALANRLGHDRYDRFPVTPVWHAHLHLISRFRNDVPNLRGGVRAVIPGKQLY